MTVIWWDIVFRFENFLCSLRQRHSSVDVRSAKRISPGIFGHRGIGGRFFRKSFWGF